MGEKIMLRFPGDFAYGDVEGFTVVATEEGDQRRWVQEMRTIARRDSDGKLFAQCWERGLTENQDSDYEDIAVEVSESVKVVETKVYTEVK